jgi:VCBS repeat-containing protein
MKNTTPKTKLNLGIRLVFILLAIMSVSIAANGATLTVMNSDNNGPGSLRQAIADAAPNDTIVFDTDGVFASPRTITVAPFGLYINKNLTIQGPGASQLTVSGGNASGVFVIGTGIVTLDGLTITGGNFHVGGIDGCGILNNLGTVTVSNTAVLGNIATTTGGILNDGGVMTISNSTVSGNSGDSGGGIYNGAGATLTVSDSTVSGNSADSGGGGIYSLGTLTVSNSTISGNSTAFSGGGIYNRRTLTVSNSTIFGNSAGVSGGGIYNLSGILTLNSSIVASNTASTGQDISGIVPSGDYNLIKDTAGIVSLPGTHNITGVDPMLGPLADNGGPTLTYALLPGSPAIDAGSNPDSLTTDQRGTGFARVVGTAADIGAFEVQPAPCTGLSFATAVNYPAGSNPPSVTTGDFDGDGKTDLAVANPVSGTISVRLGNGDGTFAAAVSYPAGSLPFSVTTGDFNGDGKTDLAVANLLSNNVSVLLNNGDGTFAAAVSYTVGSMPRSVTTGDFNGDGKTDVAVANDGSSNVSVLLNNGDGTFAAAVSYPAGSVPFSVTTGDFNGVGKTDLAVANELSNNISVLLNNGDGTFAAAVSYTVGMEPLSVTRGDFNGDSKTDLAVANPGSANISVLLGNGDGTFAAAVSYSAGSIPFSVTTGDFNGDGKTDLAVANRGSDNISVLLGNGDGTFASAVNFAVGTSPVAASTGDFNGDGKTDLVVANLGSSNVSVLLNNSCSSNTAPVANNDGYSTNEDTPLNVAAPGVLANDTDGEGDPLTAILVSGPSNAQSFTLNADGSFSYTPNANFNGGDSFTYKANDGSLDSNTATVTITINPVNDAPIVSATPKTQSSVQYSDPISTVTITASDLETPTASLSIAFSYTKDGGSSVAGLPAGMTQGGVAGAWTVSGVAGVPQGTYVITASVTDTGDGASPALTSSDTFTIVVTRENAVAAPQMNNPVSMQVSSPGGTATGTTAQICFDITEVADGSLGDTSLITAATVQISAIGGGGAGGITPSAVTFSGGGVGGTRTACFTLNLSGVAPNVYEVTLVIGGVYYTGSGTTAFTVYDPSSGFVSGGGWIINPNTGYRANYGVNIKYLKSGAAQGSLLYVEHRPDGDYKLKSTALNAKGGFAIVPITGGAEADIAGKANYVVNDVGTGNYSFIARVIDKGTPGTNDQFGLKLIDPLGQVVTGFTFDPASLGGGNNQVPKK